MGLGFGRLRRMGVIGTEPLRPSLSLTAWRPSALRGRTVFLASRADAGRGQMPVPHTFAFFTNVWGCPGSRPVFGR